MLRPGCALPFTSGPQTRSPIFQSATELVKAILITTITVANLIGIDGRARAASNRANYRALFSTNQAAQKCSAHCAPRSSDLVSVFLPDRPVVITIAVVWVNGLIVSIDVAVIPRVVTGIAIVAITVARISSLVSRTTAARLRRYWQGHHAKNYQGNKSGKNFFHLCASMTLFGNDRAMQAADSSARTYLVSRSVSCRSESKRDSWPAANDDNVCRLGVLG